METILNVVKKIRKTHSFASHLGRVVRKPVNANPGLKVTGVLIFLQFIKLIFIAYVLCSLSLVKLKTEGRTV